MTGQPNASTKLLVRARAHDRCERCGSELDGWDGGSYHHRRIKGMGGDRRPETNLPANLLLLCGSGTTRCHGWVHAGGNRAAALEGGWLVSRWALPGEQPVVLALLGRRLLDDAGGTREPLAA